jgi:hypothetical protein
MCLSCLCLTLLCCALGSLTLYQFNATAAAPTSYSQLYPTTTAAGNVTALAVEAVVGVWARAEPTRFAVVSDNNVVQIFNGNGAVIILLLSMIHSSLWCLPVLCDAHSHRFVSGEAVEWRAAVGRVWRECGVQLPATRHLKRHQ